MIADRERHAQFVYAVITDQFDFFIVVGGEAVQADYRRFAEFIDVLALRLQIWCRVISELTEAETLGRLLLLRFSSRLGRSV